MERERFKEFKKVIATAERDHHIWWEGYLFINLTEKQNKEIVEILINRGFAVDDDVVYMPSGLGLRIINPFEAWLTDGKHGGAAKLLQEYQKV